MSGNRSRESVHRRALSAAAGVVGRPRVQAGALALGLATLGGCVIVDKGDGDESAGATSEAATDASDGSSTTIADASSSGGGGTDSEGDTWATTTWGTTDMTSGTGTDSATSSGSGEATTTTTGEGTSTSTGTGEGTTTDTSGGDTEANPCVSPEGEVDWECCEENDWMPAPQCTPWGPPAPPVYRARPGHAPGRASSAGALV